MDNKDFDKVFSDKLKETQSFEFMESDWEDVASRLEDPERKRRWGFWFWTLGAACLMLAFTSIYLVLDLNNTKKELATVQQSILNQTSATTSISSSTSNNETEKQIVIEYDTIVKTIYQTEIKQKKATTFQYLAKSKKEQNNKTLNPTTKNIDRTLTNQTNIAITETALAENANQSVAKVEEKVEAILNESKTASDLVGIDLKVNEISLNSLSAFPIDSKISEEYPELVLPKGKKESKHRSRLGIVTGWSLPVNPASDTDFNGNLKRSAFDVGLHYRFDITKRINAWASVSYHQAKYKTKNVSSEANYSLIEGVIKLAPNDLFDINSSNVLADQLQLPSDILIKRKAIQYSLGVNYSFLQKKRWGLYAGLSAHFQSGTKRLLNASRTSDDDAAFEEVEQDPGGDTEPEVTASEYATSSINPEKFEFNVFGTQLGYQLELSPRLLWQVEAMSKLKIKSNGIYEPFGIRTLVSYRF